METTFAGVIAREKGAHSAPPKDGQCGCRMNRQQNAQLRHQLQHIKNAGMSGRGIRPWPTRKRAGAIANGSHRPVPRPNGSEPRSVWLFDSPPVGLTPPKGKKQTRESQEQQAVPPPRANALAVPRHLNATRGITAKPGSGHVERSPLATIAPGSFPVRSGWPASVQTKHEYD